MKKPSLKQMVKAYHADYTNGWCNLILKNENVLFHNEYKDYNKKNFKTLIESIELNGVTNFNMSTFVSNIKRYLDADLDLLPYEFELGKKGSEESKNSFSSTTSSFNCDSVGCIAGFATANALNWKQPRWLKGDARDHVEFFEQVACNWLDIPIDCGRNIFYGDSTSVWSFLKFFEPENYGEIEWVDESKSYSHYDQINSDPFNEEWHFYSSSVTLHTISHKCAVDVLRRIVDGEILMDHRTRFIPIYSMQYKNKIKKQNNK